MKFKKDLRTASSDSLRTYGKKNIPNKKLSFIDVIKRGGSFNNLNFVAPKNRLTSSKAIKNWPDWKRAQK